MATGGKTTAPDVKNDVGPNTLTCAVCLEQYQRPKLLPCFHTFCQHCLQAVAGTSPSFPCPACRTIVLLPPGGVSALQTNFYIEQDEDVQTPSPARLCDVCIQDKEATHLCLQCQQRYCGPCRKVHDSITSSRAHTVVPLQPGGPGGDVRQVRPEELCPEHKSRALVLHCVPCRANICLQCKQTAHKGHTVEDLQDMENKVKARLQQKLQTLSHQRSRLQGVLAAVKIKQDVLSALHNTTEQGIRDRVMKVHQLVDECQENTLGSLENLHLGLLESLSGTEDGLQHRHAALTAQSEHITRVLRDGKHTDIVDLETKLDGVSVDDEQTVQTLSRLQSDLKPYICEHNPMATNSLRLQEFVGVLKKTDVENTNTKPSATPTHDPAQSAAVPKPEDQLFSFLEVVYSRNPRCTVLAICATSEKRVWIKYKPSGEGEVMVLLGTEGVLNNAETVFPTNVLATVTRNITVGFGDCKVLGLGVIFGYDLYTVNTDGLTSKICKSLVPVDSTAKTSRVFLYTANRTECCQFRVSAVDMPWDKTVIHSEKDLGLLKDVSRCQKYFVFVKNYCIHLYFREGSLRKMSTYCPAYQQKILDACFFPVGGKETLLVVVEGDNQVHVLDHTDGCCFVQYLDTGHLTLQNPRLLATDQETVLWVACDGGRLIMMQVEANKSHDSDKPNFSYRCGIL